MIILDIETGGLDPITNPMLSLGAVDYNTCEEFYGECRASQGTNIDDRALEVNGFTMAQCQDVAKDTEADLYAKFLSWCVGRETLLAGQQVGAFDIRFLREIHDKNKTVTWSFGGMWPFGHRSVDLHSVAFAQLGKSLSLDGILTAVGLSPEPKPHNALTGARLERDAFKRLLGAPGWKS